MLTAAELRELEARATGGPKCADGVVGCTCARDRAFIERDDALRNHAKFLAAALEVASLVKEPTNHPRPCGCQLCGAFSRFRDAQREGG